MFVINKHVKFITASIDKLPAALEAMEVGGRLEQLGN